MDNNKIGAVLVIGGGIGGIQASLDLAEQGFKVYLLEEKPSIGGVMAKLDKTFPTNDCAMCILAPKLVDCGRHPNVELITYAELEEVEGEAGNFKAKIRKLPSFVDFSKCTGCSECEKACPVELKSEFNEGLDNRHAIYRLYPQAIPNVYAIEKKEGRAPCKVACPAGVNAQGYIQLISQGKFQEALGSVRKRNPFPGICGRVCHHPCENECLRATIDSPVAIRALKRFVADYELRNGPQSVVQGPRSENGKRVAIIGSGPAGLTCANDLACLGYQVTIFEKEGVLGGMMRLGIPEYRLPREVLQREIDSILKLGVEVKLNTEIGRDIAIEDLKKHGYKAVFIATGAHLSQRLEIHGEDLDGVFHGVTFLRNLNLGKEVKFGDRVAIVGGGNVAIDSARSVLRLGCKEVSIIYRRSRQEMPANEWEVEEAEEEGIKIHYLAAPTKVLDKDGKVGGIECVRMELGEPDDSGRQRPIPIKGSEFTIDIDVLILAIGQSPDLSLLPKDSGFKITKWKTLDVDPITFETSEKGIFAAGDAVLGPATVIEAIAQGHEVAESIDRYLGGEDLKAGREKKEEKKVTEIHEEVERRNREEIPRLSVAGRIKGFDEIEKCYTEAKAKKEAKRCLSCSICSECLQCIEACKAEAINHEMQEEIIELDVGSIILSPGFDKFDPKLKHEYGYGRYKNVITSLEFERILSASGPFQGHLQRLSDGVEPKRIAFIQCVGSRDAKQGNDYCSSICCTYAIKEAIIAKEHSRNGLDTTVFYMDMRTYGKGFDEYFTRAKLEYGVGFVRARISEITEVDRTKNLRIRYEDESGGIIVEEFDLVVLSIGFTPKKEVKELAERLGIGLNDYGFCATSPFSPIKTSRTGVFVAGAFQSPKDIPETVSQASAAASQAAQLLSSERGKLIQPKEYPKEVDIVSIEPRIGVFVCHCGINIANYVDVEALVDYAQTLPNVVYAEQNLFTCSQDTQVKIKEMIKEHTLNRVVVASCSPRTHEPLFQQTLREAGLNPYLFEMANIRDQCSWVHMDEGDRATQKAKVLIRMGVSKVALQEPLKIETFGITKKGLVIGGGLSGMISSLSIAEQGYEVYLIEKELELGGNLIHIYYTLNGDDVQMYLGALIKRIESNGLIHVYKGARIKEVTGYVGNFKTKIEAISKKQGAKEEIEIGHGVIIVATGGVEYEPKGEYLYGEDERVITQRQLEERLAEVRSQKSEVRSQNFLNLSSDICHLSSVVMIQCVGSRSDERTYCSRYCCSEAVKNVLRLKEINPEVDIYVLYKDIRTYGFWEKYYRKAREAGIIFIRYDDENKPEVRAQKSEVRSQLEVLVFDPILQERLVIKPDLVVLSLAILPHPDNELLAGILKVPLTSDNFFLEAHPKLRPVDFATDGIFLAGLCHSPKMIDESIAQSYAAASRTCTILFKNELEAEGVVSVIDPCKCASCLTCIRVCPYNAPFINLDGIAEIEAVKCHGCGTCASECPGKAIQLMNYKDSQVLAKTEALVG